MKFLPPTNFTGDDFPAVTNVLTALGPSCVPNFLLLMVFPLLASLVDAAWLSAVALSLFLLAFLYGLLAFTDISAIACVPGAGVPPCCFWRFCCSWLSSVVGVNALA